MLHDRPIEKLRSGGEIDEEKRHLARVWHELSAK